MLKLRKLRMDPPGGWWYMCEDGFIVRAGHYEKLVRFTKDHLRVNNMEIPDNLEDLIQHQICLRTPESICIGEGPRRRFPTVEVILKGTKKITSMFRKGKYDKQPQSVQQPRMTACISCRFNGNRMGCFKCELPFKISAHAFGDLGNYDLGLHACDYFEAAGLALTSAPDEVLRSVFSDVDLSDAPLNCWMLTVLASRKRTKKNAKLKRGQRSKSANRRKRR